MEANKLGVEMVTLAVTDSPKQCEMESPRPVDCKLEKPEDIQQDFDKFMKQNQDNVDPFGVVKEELNEKVIVGSAPTQLKMYPTICSVEVHECFPTCGKEGLHCHQYPACDKEGVHCMPGAGSQRSQTETPLEELRPCAATICCIDSLYCQFPQCIGCSEVGMGCCCMYECVCCKMLDCSDEDSKCCALVANKTYLKIPQNCCYFQRQLCCVDERGEFPCGQKVPCMVNALFLTCCADYQCKMMFCKQIKEIVPRFDPKQKDGAQ